MQAELQAQMAFYLTERSSGGKLDSVGELGLRPALFAGYRDLTKLRYDFPLVLIAGVGDETAVQSLSGLFDRALQEIAEGADGDRLRKHALRIEQEIRALSAQGATGRLSVLWDTAASRLSVHNDQLFQDSLKRLRAALKVDGEVIDCDQAMPFRLFHHVWKILFDRKASSLGKDIGRLITKLSDILAADLVRSEEGLSAEALKSTVGGGQQAAFDFDAMSRLLREALPKARLPKSRRRRLEGLLSVLESQRFFAVSNASDKAVGKPYDFVFESCADALEAYRARLPAMTELAKAMAIAELEIEGRYDSSKHDVFFEEFGAAGLDPGELARFPDYLICIGADDVPEVLKAFAAGLPAKVLVQTDDLLEPSPVGGEHIALALGSKQLAGAAIGHSAFYVMQSSSSNLFQLREQIFRGLAYPGPALFSVFSGATADATDLPPYLTAAAAMESRAFPAFTYDPSAGPDLASRFHVNDNPGADLDWPVQSLAYEDQEHLRISETLEFSLVDFVACDRRYARHFARVPRAKWNDSMAPVSEFLASKPNGLSEKVPYLLMVDRNNVLQKVIVDDRLVREARNCADMWHSLQELGGIHNSHAARLVAQERKAWLEQSQRDTESRGNAQSPAGETSVAVAAAAATAAAAVSEPAETQRSSDDPYIETARCTSCNECTLINDKMFAYDANKQASIVNPDAGTYRQLVEAAEGCQVSIIHPGKPRNPNEPGLDELIKRAEPFL
jgi:hypothetical protein